jgi:hypothetical protein
MINVYCINYTSHAGKWIYDGYRNAWKSLNYNVLGLNNLTMDDKDFYIMTTDSWVNEDNFCFLKKAKKVFLFVQPSIFPSPWGAHPNFVSQASPKVINFINNLNNVTLWTFANVREEFYNIWQKKVHTIPLAYDSISYKIDTIEKNTLFDVCYVGGWANNGFNEKKKIMLDVFSKFRKTNLSCGFFINKNLNHLQECKVIYNSKVCLNIHDAYQRKLGLDTNERTFKSLGLNGLLVSDTVHQLCDLFPGVPNSLDSDEIVYNTKSLLNLPHDELSLIREKNKKDVINNHTYIKRLEKLLST